MIKNWIKDEQLRKIINYDGFDPIENKNHHSSLNLSSVILEEYEHFFTKKTIVLPIIVFFLILYCLWVSLQIGIEKSQSKQTDQMFVFTISQIISASHMIRDQTGNYDHLTEQKLIDSRFLNQKMLLENKNKNNMIVFENSPLNVSTNDQQVVISMMNISNSSCDFLIANKPAAINSISNGSKTIDHFPIDKKQTEDFCTNSEHNVFKIYSL